MSAAAELGRNEGSRGSLPLVSIITIFLNAERFIGEAVESVLAQTERHWELLLVDDGSTDASTTIARDYASRDPRISYLQHADRRNHGMSASRSLGASRARGTYLAFLDADDVYLAEKLERQIATLEAHSQAAMVYGPSLHWHSWTGRAKDVARDVPRRLGVTPDRVYAPPELVRAYLRREADTPATCSVLVRRRAFEATGGFESAFVDLYEDQVFFYKLALSFPVYVESRAWDRYRRHPDALCEVRIRAGEHRDDYGPTPARGRFLKWLEGYFDEVEEHDLELRQMLRRELRPYRHPLAYRTSEQIIRLARSRWLRPFLPVVSRSLTALQRAARQLAPDAAHAVVRGVRGKRPRETISSARADGDQRSSARG